MAMKVIVIPTEKQGASPVASQSLHHYINIQEKIFQTTKENFEVNKKMQNKEQNVQVSDTTKV